jgi:uncharacterized protein (TIGR03083 family)
MLPEPALSMAAYTELRGRLSALLTDVSDETGATVMVPGCPEWSVTDAVAHIGGVCVDVLDGNVAAAGTKAWADLHVERFASLGLAAVIECWSDVASTVEELGPAFPPQAAAQFVFDATTHEQDIRGALGRPGARDTTSVVVGLAFLGTSLDQYVRENDLPSLTLTSPEWSMTAGEGPVEVEVKASAFELLRSFGGRRSVDQFRSLDWTGDPAPYLRLLDGDRAIGLRDEPLIEG